MRAGWLLVGLSLLMLLASTALQIQTWRMRRQLMANTALLNETRAALVESTGRVTATQDQLQEAINAHGKTLDMLDESLALARQYRGELTACLDRKVAMTEIHLTCRGCRQQFAVSVADPISADPRKRCPACRALERRT